MEIKDIWIESENKSTVIDGEIETNDNSDVIVTMTNDKKYIATFFTYKNIEFLRRKNQRTNESLKGKYFYATDMILIERINRTEIMNVIKHQIKIDEFESAFRLISDE
jgi:hypothetical protein